MRTEGWKRLGIALSVFWVFFLFLGTYLEYEKIRTTKDIVAVLVPDQTFWKIKSTHLFFDRYYKQLLTDKEVGLGKLPAPEIPDILVIKAAKFAVMAFVPLLAFWGLGALLFWVLVGFRKRTSDT